MNWRVAFSIARKDIVDAVKNMYILFALIMPIVMSLLMQAVFGNIGEPGTLKVVVYDPGGSRLVENLNSLPDVAVTEVDSEEELDEQARDATGGLLVPAGFDAAVDANQQPELIVYTNDRRGGGELAAFRGLVEQQIWQLKGVSMPAKIAWNSVGSPRLLQGEAQVGDVMTQYFFIMLLVMGLAMVGVFVVPYLLIEEKEKHTLDALLVTPAGPAEVAAGKAMVGIFYCAVVSIVLAFLNKGWAGNWAFTLAAMALGSLMMVAIGLFLGGFLNTMHQVNTWSSVLMLTLLLPSWFTGIIDVPSLETVSKIIPSYYLADTLTLSLPGMATFANVWLNLAILLACVILIFGAVVWSLRRERVA
jgi:ABC-2 type transport system permease protein